MINIYLIMFGLLPFKNLDKDTDLQDQFTKDLEIVLEFLQADKTGSAKSLETLVRQGKIAKEETEKGVCQFSLRADKTPCVCLARALNANVENLFLLLKENDIVKDSWSFVQVLRYIEQHCGLNSLALAKGDVTDSRQIIAAICPINTGEKLLEIKKRERLKGKKKQMN